MSTRPPAPTYKFDELLREVPEDMAAFETYFQFLQNRLKIETRSAERAAVLGELGVVMRIANRLDEAESTLRDALKLITNDRLGVRRQVQQNLRLANVLQWQGRFEESNALFADALKMCRAIAEAMPFLDFALQHSAKNFFEQKNYREALPLLEEALKIRKRREAPPDQISSTELAIAATKEKLKGSG